MSDLKLLEMAAKAAGIKHVDYEGVGYDGSAGLVIVGEHGQHLHGWNPLANDGDAFRLACRMGMCVDAGCGIIVYDGDAGNEMEFEKPSDIANVRRAIVRAAAEIGKTMS